MKIAVVTGASSGMGKEFAKSLYGMWGIEEIWAIARNKDKLQSLSDECAFPIRTFSIDVSDRQAVAALTGELESACAEVVCLANCAGYGKFCSYKDLSVSQSLDMINTNIGGVVAMTLTVLPFMHSGSRIINISSASAFQPLPYINVYGSTKVFVRNYSRALNRELRPRGISVTCVCPYWVSTGFFSVAHEHTGKRVVTKYEVMYTPQRVVSKALHDAQNRRDMSVCGFVNKLQHVCAKLLPQSMVMSVWQNRHKLYENKEES